MRELSLKLHRIFLFFILFQYSSFYSLFFFIHSFIHFFLPFCFHIRWMYECLLVLFVWFYDIFRSSCMVGCDASGSCLKRQIKRVLYILFSHMSYRRTFFIFRFNLIRLQQQAMRKISIIYCLIDCCLMWIFDTREWK